MRRNSFALRHVILAVGDRRQIVTGESAQEYVIGGARWAGKSKAHFNEDGYFVLNSKNQCRKCSAKAPCATVTLSVLDAVPVSARSRPSIASPSSLTANDILLNIEGSRRAQNKAYYFDKLDDGRPAGLDPRMLWVKLPRAVYGPEGLRLQMHVLTRDGADLLLPKGNSVHLALQPKTPERFEIARGYVNWINLAVHHVLGHWDPPPEMLDSETQELKRDLVEADLVRILATIRREAQSDARPPKEIDKIWPAIVVKFDAGPHSKKLNATKASDLGISIVRHLLQEYLRL
jgi:hypothetical protein